MTYLRPHSSYVTHKETQIQTGCPFQCTAGLGSLTRFPALVFIGPWRCSQGWENRFQFCSFQRLPWCLPLQRGLCERAAWPALISNSSSGFKMLFLCDQSEPSSDTRWQCCPVRRSSHRYLYVTPVRGGADLGSCAHSGLLLYRGAVESLNPNSFYF